MKKLMFLLLSCLSVYGAEMPKGYGGVLFGQTLNKVENSFEPASLYYREGYAFEPTEKFMKFDKYYFMVMPQSKKVYKIIMEANFKNGKEAQSYMDVIIGLMSGRYGDFTSVNMISVYLSKDQICISCFYVQSFTGKAIVYLSIEDESLLIEKVPFKNEIFGGFETGDK